MRPTYYSVEFELRKFKKGKLVSKSLASFERLVIKIPDYVLLEFKFLTAHSSNHLVKHMIH